MVSLNDTTRQSSRGMFASFDSSFEQMRAKFQPFDDKVKELRGGLIEFDVGDKTFKLVYQWLS